MSYLNTLISRWVKKEKLLWAGHMVRGGGKILIKRTLDMRRKKKKRSAAMQVEC